MAGADYNIKNNKIAGRIKYNSSANNVTQPRPLGDDVEGNTHGDQNNGLSLPIITSGANYPREGAFLIFNSDRQRGL